MNTYEFKRQLEKIGYWCEFCVKHKVLKTGVIRYKICTRKWLPEYNKYSKNTLTDLYFGTLNEILEKHFPKIKN